jgi:hypothetical protein
MKINEKNDISGLNLQCYMCESSDHISVDCPTFHKISGNLRRYLGPTHGLSNNSDHEGNE